MAELDARRTEVLGNAARTIQRQVRTYIARKEFISLRRAAFHLQSHCRGILLTSFETKLVCNWLPILLTVFIFCTLSSDNIVQ